MVRSYGAAALPDGSNAMLLGEGGLGRARLVVVKLSRPCVVVAQNALRAHYVPRVFDGYGRCRGVPEQVRVHRAPKLLFRAVGDHAIKAMRRERAAITAHPQMIAGRRQPAPERRIPREQ